MSSSAKKAPAAGGAGAAAAALANVPLTKESAVVAVHHLFVVGYLLRALWLGSFLSVLLGIAFGVLSCELSTACWTFILDNYGSEKTKLVGPLIKLLRDRKVAPLGNYFNNAWIECAITISVLYFPALLLGFGKCGFTAAIFAAGGFWAAQTGVLYNTNSSSSSSDDAAAGPAAPLYKALRTAHTTLNAIVVSKLHALQVTECVVYYATGVIAASSTINMVEPARETRSERVRHLKWLLWYRLFDWVTRRNNLQLRFMNWGYHKGKPQDAAPYPLLENADMVLPKDENLRAIDTTSLQLYLHLLNGPSVDFNGKDVVEVSSGKGGGLSCLAASGRCRSCTGIDLCEGNIEYCRNSYKDIKNLEFKFGDAMGNLGVEADIVLNVEASHCYPSRAQFFKSVHSALRAGGRLLFVDFMYPQDVAEIRQALTKDGLYAIEKDEDITADVLAAMDKTDQPKRTLIDTHVPKWMASFVHRFAATKESMMYVNLGNKSEVYHLFQARKL